MDSNQSSSERHFDSVEEHPSYFPSGATVNPLETTHSAPKRSFDYGAEDFYPKRLRGSPNDSISTRSTPYVWSPLLEVDASSWAVDTQVLPRDVHQDDRENDEPGFEAAEVHNIPMHSQLVPMEGVEHLQVFEGNTGEMICFGALCGAKMFLVNTKSLSSLLRGVTGKFVQFQIVVSGQNFALSHHPGHIFAHIDSITCRNLRKLDGIDGVESKAVVETRMLMVTGTTIRTKGIVPFSINICGPPAIADEVGNQLSNGSACLQIPYFLEPGWEYFNPQLFRSGPEMQNLTHLVGLTENDFRAKAISDAVENVFESLGFLQSNPGQGIYPTVSQPDTITTPLRSHQLDALSFIQRRESHNLCQSAQSELRRLVDTAARDDIPSHSAGGILADVMGLGKTLTLLSSIAATADVAKQWSTKPIDMTDETAWRSRATLVVVTSMQVLDVWTTEITTHMKKDALTTFVFHGKSRPGSPERVIDYDIVLTTYATLASDHKNQALLQKVHWYRVVLDEAHWIRNQSSYQFKAAEGLLSYRRWCLTGTPIQNRLEDLLSLLKFLHFEPFAHNRVFKQYILDPLSRDTPNRAFKLQALLRTICLRRTEKLLGVPKPRFEQVAVVLSPEERFLYSNIINRCAYDVDEAISGKTRKIKKYGILFTAIMRLRRVCNHGTFPIHASRSSWAAPMAEAEIESDCDFCRGDDEDKVDLVNNEEFCPECGRSFDPATRPRNTVPDINGSPSTDSYSRMTAAYDSEVQFFTQIPQRSCSTKLQTVVGRISNLARGSKSLVFSYWTSTLDLIQTHLESIPIEYLRIDGSTNFKQRMDILQHFRDSDIPVLLMSIQTGALGLNLTVANYVHIVEPQWNPSVEEQAIARAVRMGQSNMVTIVRYIVKQSVEDNIVSLQKRKSNLAKFTLDGGPGDGNKHDSLDDLKFVLNFGSI